MPFAFEGSIFVGGVEPFRPMVCRRELKALALGEGDTFRLPLIIDDLLGVRLSDAFDKFEELAGIDWGLRFGVKERKNDQSDSNWIDSNSVVREE